jgi:hypothetical protein
MDNSFLTPEQVLAQTVRFLKEHKLIGAKAVEIVPAGSVPLGTYVGKPDLDIFIVVDDDGHHIMKNLQMIFPHGRNKDDAELDIWYVRNVHGYPVDFVIVRQDDVKVQTLEHVKYYRKIITAEMSGEIRKLKQLFKDFNCYGAELGGITGICCTRLIELHKTAEQSLYYILRCLIENYKDVFVEDPTLTGRNLFASVISIKRMKMISRLSKYFMDNHVKVDIDYLFSHYDRVYKIIRRRRKYGTPKEFQHVNQSVEKSFNILKQNIRWWNPRMNHDILFTEWDIYVGISISPSEITKNTIEEIDTTRISQKSIDNLIGLGAKFDKERNILLYERELPFNNVWAVYEKYLYDRLDDRYIDYERI